MIRKRKGQRLQFQRARRGGKGAASVRCSDPAAGRTPGSASPSAGAHLLVWDAGCSWLLWKGYLNSSLLPLLPELTRITLMGLVLSPILRWAETGWGLRGGQAGTGLGAGVGEGPEGPGRRRGAGSEEDGPGRAGEGGRGGGGATGPRAEARWGLPGGPAGTR